MKLWMENEKLYKRQCHWKVTELKDLAVKFRGQNGWCHQTHGVLALPAHGYQQNWPTAQFKRFLCILMDCTEVNVLWSASWPSTVCALSLPGCPISLHRSTAWGGSCPKWLQSSCFETSSFSSIPHGGGSSRTAHTGGWTCPQGPHNSCVSLISAFPGVTGTGGCSVGCPAGNPCSSERQKLTSLAPAAIWIWNISTAVEQNTSRGSVMKAIPWARHWEFCTQCVVGRCQEGFLSGALGWVKGLSVKDGSRSWSWVLHCCWWVHH